VGLLGEKVGGAVYTAGKVTSFVGSITGGVAIAATKAKATAKAAPSLIKCLSGVTTSYMVTVSDVDEYIHNKTGVDSGTVAFKEHIDKIDGVYTVLSEVL
jgi:hypothetical protein